MPSTAPSNAWLTPYLPWLDRAGRVSAFKTLVFALLFLPGLYVAWKLATHGYARPYILANHDLGDWAIRLLFVTLAVTPFRQSLGLPKLISVRRMLGVAAFCYAMAHFTFFALDQSLRIWVIVREIALRYYLDDRIWRPADPARARADLHRRHAPAAWAARGGLRFHRLVYLRRALSPLCISSSSPRPT